MNTDPETTEVAPVAAKASRAKSEPVAEVTDFPLSLDEFCARLSGVDRRVEMIAGFHSSERAAGHSTDLEAAFAERFESFCNAPA